MQILLVNYEYPPIGGGAATACRNLAETLAGKGHNAIVLTAGFEKHTGIFSENGVKVYRLPSKREKQFRSGMLEMISFVRKAKASLGKVITDNKIEILLVFFSIPCGPVGLKAKKDFGLPYYILLRGGDVPGAEPGIGFIHSLIAPYRRKILKNAVAVIANSSSLKALSEKTDPYDCKVIPNGIDTTGFLPPQNRPLVNGSLHFLFAGRFQPQKNLFYLLEQLKKVKASNFMVHLVGDGQQRPGLESKTKEYGLENKVVFHGWLGKEKLYELYQTCHCLLLPSLYEGMSNVALEAMACGMPIVVSNVTGNTDLVEDGKNGFLFDLNDEFGLSLQMQKIIDNPGLCDQLGLFARQFVVEHYSMDSVAEQYLQLLKAK